jgi:hypothetical protein
MSSVNSISNLISNLLTSNGQTSTSDLSDLLSSITGSSSSDTVKLSDAALNKLKLLLATNGQATAGLDTSISNLLSGTLSSNNSSSSMYDILISAQNTRLMQRNPTLVNMIATVEGENSTDAENMNLVTISPTDLLSIINKYKSLASSSADTGAASPLVDEIV